MPSDSEGADDAKKMAENRKKVSEFFAGMRQQWRDKEKGRTLFNVAFTIKNRNLLGILSSLELECIEMAQDPRADAGKIIEWAKRQIEREVD